jgi:hypothetical protein
MIINNFMAAYLSEKKTTFWTGQIELTRAQKEIARIFTALN